MTVRGDDEQAEKEGAERDAHLDSLIWLAASVLLLGKRFHLAARASPAAAAILTGDFTSSGKTFSCLFTASGLLSFRNFLWLLIGSIAEPFGGWLGRPYALTWLRSCSVEVVSNVYISIDGLVTYILL